ncbi:MAG: NAD-glutamate dehydrogenase [Bdellovibrionota bacterium]
MLKKNLDPEQEEMEEVRSGALAESLEFENEMKGEELETYISDIADTVKIGLDQSIAILTPWFFNNMPRIYYATTPRAEKTRHLSAVITGHIFETKQTVELWDRDRSKVTYIGPGGDRKILMSMASRLGPLDLKMGSLYFSRDHLLFLSTFFCDSYKAADIKNKYIAEKIETAKDLLLGEFPECHAKIDQFLENLDHDFVTYATAARLHITFRMYHHMLMHEGAHTIIEPFKNSPTARLSIGFRDVNISDVMENVLRIISRFGFNIVRGFAVRFHHNLQEPILVLHFVVRYTSGEAIQLEDFSILKLNKALRTLGWVDNDEYAELGQEPADLSINGVNLIRSMASWVHVLLGKENPYYYSEYKIRTTFFSYPELTSALVDLFRLKFSPNKGDQRKNDGYEKFRNKLITDVQQLIDPVERRIFRECLKFTDHVLKTNYFLPTKTGLAFRLSPEVLDEKYYPNKPFGIFFVVGLDFRMFQIRWKDISRGGLRIVMPRNPSDYGFALSGLFDEVYGLSHAQQLKNKDIPEGGSKAVLLLTPGGNKKRAVRGAINALLDLLVQDDEIHEEKASKQVSYYKREEIIYLGPDENMSNDLIEWVPEQAAKRGYPYAAAFMSSKPSSGINHKEYGVTSEGLNVFLEHTLKFLGINPKKDAFTVKLTGGPDGDVAGNELKILHREYGENPKVVAIADGYGAAYDPNGLNWQELLSLVERGLSICEFDKAKLSSSQDAFVINADTSDNIRRRNELHSLAVADVFIPAGGRPFTVNEKNWNRFIDPSGTPTCKAIVEGANIFFTTEARDNLQNAGIIMIKDSSANKTGVICSSFEIIASLLLTEEEFVEIKDVYVLQVVEILKQKAGAEANLLIAEYVKSGRQKRLVDLSMEISKEINLVTDIIHDELDKNKEELVEAPLFKHIIEKHCPTILRERYLARIHSGLPIAHKVAIIAASIASYIVYREGLGWLQTINPEDRYRATITYMEQVQLTDRLISAVKGSNIDEKERIASILRMSAARNLTMLEMASEPLKDI